MVGEDQEKKMEESGLGQLMMYLLGAHVQRFKEIRDKTASPIPILGVYMEGLQVCLSLLLCVSFLLHA